MPALTTAFGGAVCPGLSWTYWMTCLTDGAAPAGSVTVVCTVVVAVRRPGAANAVIRALAVATAPIPNAIRRGRASGRALGVVAEGVRTVADSLRRRGRHSSRRLSVPDAGHQSSPSSSSDSPPAALTTLWTVIVFCFAGGAT